MKDIIFEFKNTSKSFPGVKALNNISFTIRRECVHCIVGENGAGKSTLLKIIEGLYKKDSGEIFFNDRPWSPGSSADAHRSGIYMIHQEVNRIPGMMVYENMFLGREMLNKNLFTLNDKFMYQKAKEYIELEGMKIDPRQKMKNLSIAEAQMIEIIKATTVGAQIILMDEPTSSLSDKEIKFLFEKITALRKQGITIIYISHKLEEIFEIGDYISVFRDGMHIKSGPISDFTKNTVIENMVGRKMSEVYPSRASLIGDTVFAVKNFSHSDIFRNINFSVKRGEILGIFGLVGAGRTEIIRSIIGLDSKDSGEIYWQDKRLSIENVNDAISNGIAMISEDRRRYGFIPLMGVRENISLVALFHLYKKAVIPKKVEVKSVVEMIKRLSIKASNFDTKLGTLSGGNQQKVVLAKWLLVSPNVLIMDEPTRGIDVGTKYEIYKLMNKMTDNGMCIIMVNSDIEELMGMSDRIIVIREGEITGELEKKDATAEKIMHFAMGGGG